MKINPLNFLLDKDFDVDKKFYFISGNETTLMEKIKLVIIAKYQEKEMVSVTNIDTIKDFVDEVGLFESFKIFLGNSCKGVDEKNLNKLKNVGGIFIFVEENSQKNKVVKSFFNKDRDSCLIDCYTFEKDARIKILNNFLSQSKLNISQDIYWFLIDKLDSKYIFFENGLKKILELSEKDFTFKNIIKLITVDDSDKQSVFFNLLKKNSEIIDIYRNKIVDYSDVNQLYYYSKFFCQLIIESNNEIEYQKKIPLYMFKQKNFLIDVYRKYNSKKKKLLIRLLSTTEKALRKESGLSLIAGLRFILSIKKITVS
tara:strand:+ start:89 stop:1027 length:939 start_codon:yes stop_codon:yes gene_type:complete